MQGDDEDDADAEPFIADDSDNGRGSKEACPGPGRRCRSR